jgi:aerobic-type carbon monoxide dehydrogenase small subunit (CoxS/CutS family)
LTDITLTLNGERTTVTGVPEDRYLVDLLRDTLGLTGTKRGCETGTCGACAVLLDGEKVRSCRTRAVEVAGRTVTTIEGLRGPDGGLSDLQQAFLETGAVQCGFCTPGMVIAGEALLRADPTPSREAIRKAIALHLCRCTGYQQIVDAIERTARRRAARAAAGTEGR